MNHQPYAEALAQVAIALVVALIFAPVVRSVAVELNGSVGRVWPFSLAHCHVAASPGCEPAPPRLAQGTRPGLAGGTVQ